MHCKYLCVAMVVVVAAGTRLGRPDKKDLHPHTNNAKENENALQMQVRNAKGVRELLKVEIVEDVPRGQLN